MGALDKQINGQHYKGMAIQPIVYCERNHLGACESNIVKYISRWRLKGGIEDLQKIKHYCDILIELNSEQKPEPKPKRELGEIDDPKLKQYLDQQGCEGGTCEF